ncbi:hypothetical protein SeLEV6574_g00023 [Synchytrium endobioticum]|uniref:Uncharacterized protein n=1 Tax=Synchytrium endobioticum TaxID=286115 RepID=A0A507DLU9_9FUNG|nr:hypothetical protein SeLEV6574_g00023 [Synchytrium endobioticum]
MVNIVRGYLEHDERPNYLKPPFKDKNTPMKRKADEGGTSQTTKQLRSISQEPQYSHSFTHRSGTDDHDWRHVYHDRLHSHPCLNQLPPRPVVGLVSSNTMGISITQIPKLNCNKVEAHRGDRACVVTSTVDGDIVNAPAMLKTSWSTLTSSTSSYRKDVAYMAFVLAFSGLWWSYFSRMFS